MVTPRFRCFPRRRERLVQRLAILIGQSVTFIVQDEIHDRPFGQARRLIEDETPTFDARAEWIHGINVRLGIRSRNLFVIPQRGMPTQRQFDAP